MRKYNFILIIFFSDFCFSSTIIFEVPFIINHNNTGDITIELVAPSVENPEAKVSLQAARFVALTTDFATQEQLENWLGKATLAAAQAKDTSGAESKMISLADLLEKGLDISFDPGLLAVKATIPRLGTQALSFGRSSRPQLNSAKPAKLATGANLRYRAQYDHRAKKGQDALRSSSVGVNGFVAVGGSKGVSLNFSGNYNERDSQYSPSQAYLQHDNTRHSIRFLLGDVRPNIGDFQRIGNIYGLNIVRDYAALNPSRTISQSGYRRFRLEQDATVKFFVNGIEIDEQRLSTGDYSIEDFPLVAGYNRIEIEIDDGLNPPQRERFSVFMNNELLAHNIINFGLTAGFLDKNKLGSENLLLLGYLQKGLLNNWTLGLNIEHAEQQQLYYLDSIYGTPLGIVNLQLAYSDSEQFAEGQRYKLQWQPPVLALGEFSWRSFLEFEKIDKHFISLGMNQPHKESKRINWRNNFKFSKTSLNIGLQKNDSLENDSEYYSIGLNQYLGGVSLGVNYFYSDSSGKINDGINFSINRRFNSYSINSDYDVNSENSNLHINSSSARELGDFSADMALRKRKNAKNIEFGIKHISSRFDVSARHRQVHFTQNNKDANINSDLRLNTAIGFADGYLGFGRPFNNSFAIVSRHKNLRGKRFTAYQNRLDSTRFARSQQLGGLLVPINTAYSAQRYAFDVEDLPLGYDLGEGGFNALSENRAAVVYQLGSAAANIAMGVLLSPDGEPLNLKSGKLIGKTDQQETPFFTNRTGRFVAEKMRPGDYRLQLEVDSELWFADISLVEGDEPGIIQLGTIQLEVGNE